MAARFFPGDAGYDAERSGYNQIVDHSPAIVVTARGTEDVIAAVDIARTEDTAVGMQATGHGVSVPADDAVLVSTRHMNGVRIDPVARRARIEAGVRSITFVTGSV